MSELTAEQKLSLEAIRHNAVRIEWETKRGQLYLETGHIACLCHGGEIEPSQAKPSLVAKIDSYCREYASLASMAARLAEALPEHSEELEEAASMFRESAKLLDPFASYEDAITDRREIEGFITEIDMLALNHTTDDIIESFYPTV